MSKVPHKVNLSGTQKHFNVLKKKKKKMKNALQAKSSKEICVFVSNKSTN
jgi:hypothetical protein